MNENKIVCNKCNYENIPNNHTCINCGTNLQKENLKIKKVRNANQLLLIYMGYCFIYVFIFIFFIIFSIFSKLFYYLITLLILYIPIRRIFVNNLLYKNQTEKFINRVKTLYIILFVINLFVLFIKQFFIIDFFSFFINSSYIFIMVNDFVMLFAFLFIIPIVLFTDAIKKYAKESDEEEY